eukprot:SAG25_NODE_1787_length_2334_cov_2.713647_1_plen_185_part_00
MNHHYSTAGLSPSAIGRHPSAVLPSLLLSLPPLPPSCSRAPLRRHPLLGPAWARGAPPVALGCRLLLVHLPPGGRALAAGSSAGSPSELPSSGSNASARLFPCPPPSRGLASAARGRRLAVAGRRRPRYRCSVHLSRAHFAARRPRGQGQKGGPAHLPNMDDCCFRDRVRSPPPAARERLWRGG